MEGRSSGLDRFLALPGQTGTQRVVADVTIGLLSP